MWGKFYPQKYFRAVQANCIRVALQMVYETFSHGNASYRRRPTTPDFLGWHGID